MDMLLLYKRLEKTLKKLRSTDAFISNEILARTEDMLMSIMDDVWHQLTREQIEQYNKDMIE